MQIKEIQNKQEWEDFLSLHEEKTFLQSWNWGEFQKLQKNKIWRIGIYSDGAPFAVALVVKISAKRGTFFLIPHGPVMSEDLPANEKKEILQTLVGWLRSNAKKENASFARIAPLLENSAENEKIFSGLKFRKSLMHASAYEATWKLKINQSEDVLLKNMRKTTRYLIKKTSDSRDISIEKSKNPSDIAIYQQLNKKVSERQKFVPFSDKFINDEFDAFNKDGQALLLLGKYKGEVAAGALVIFWSGIGFYHQAASLEEFSKHSIPYLLQWEAIKEAKSRGCELYDFWGFVDPKENPNHPWAGPTLFKMGYGGFKKEYIKTQDYVISQKYWINYIIELLRKIKRGL